MKIHRFFIPGDLSAGKFLECGDEKFLHQVKNVLRFQPGDKIFLFNGKQEAEAEIAEIKKEGVKLKILETKDCGTKAQSGVVLYCSILKRRNFEMVAQKATEIGVREIVPLIARRTVKLRLPEERIQKIMQEAAEQSGQEEVPVLRTALDFKEALMDAAGNDENLFLTAAEVVFRKREKPIAGEFLSDRRAVGQKRNCTRRKIGDGR